jgi:hypothetical protein
MEYEIGLIKNDTEQAGSGVNGSTDWGDTTSIRKGLRNITDDLIHQALMNDSMVDACTGMCLTMLVVAKFSYALRSIPDVRDFVEASQALIEDARSVADKGLMLHSHETTRCGAVMMEIVVRGMCAALSLPYDKLLAAVNANEDIRPILIESGHIRQEGSNEGAAH